MLHSGGARAGRPLHADPTGPLQEPKAPRKAWREDRPPAAEAEPEAPQLQQQLHKS